MTTAINATSMINIGSVSNESSVYAKDSSPGKENFQSVLDKQTENQKEDDSSLKPTTKKNQNLEKVNSKTRDSIAYNSEQPEEEKEVDEASVEMALVQVVQDILTQMAETFEIPVEQVTQTMETLELQPMDLVEENGLNELLTEIAGVEDSMTLLTDEETYQKFNDVKDFYGKLVEEISNDLNLPKEQLTEWSQKIKENDNNRMVQTDFKTVAPEETTPDIQVKNTADKEEPNRENQPSNSFEQALSQTPEELQMNPDGRVVEAEEGFTTPDTQNIMKQIMDYMKVEIKPDMSDLEMQLHPASLGTVQIHLSSKGGAITAQFITQNEAVKAAVEGQMIQLQENFEQQGIKVEAIEVSVQTNEFSRNLEQGQNGQNRGTEKRSQGTRRIRLEGGNLPEDLSEEEQITAEMMAANGNTVDFTA